MAFKVCLFKHISKLRSHDARIWFVLNAMFVYRWLCTLQCVLHFSMFFFPVLATTIVSLEDDKLNSVAFLTVFPFCK